MGGKHPGRVGLPESMDAMASDLVAYGEDICAKPRRNNEIRLLKISDETLPRGCP